MGYIKKLKNNELVGGTDKHTIYPVTSTKAVFEEVSKNNFQSQEYLNNHIYGGEGGRINKESITDYNIATGTITKGKLSPQVQTMLDEGQKKALTPKGNYNSETEYEALDLVFDPVTNSSYISLQTPNVGHPVDENAEGYEEGWWEKTLDGTAVNTAQATIDAKVDELDAQVDQAIEDARQELQDATDAANGAAEQAMSVVANKVADAQIGYFECNTAADTPDKATTSDTIGTGTDASTFKVPATGASVKIKMKYANTVDTGVKLQFGSNTATQKDFLYNGKAVSASNSWEEGEVISVYFDGTNYQASNSQGGGGKAEKIKYNNSQSGLAATDMQAGLDEVADAIFDVEYIDATLPAHGTNMWINDSGVWADRQTTEYYLVPVNEGEVYRLTANANGHVQCAYLTNNSISGAASFVAGTTKTSVPASSERDISIPDGTAYLYVLYNVGKTVRLSSLKIRTTINALDKRINELDDAINDVQTSEERAESYNLEGYTTSNNKTFRMRYNCGTHGRATVNFTAPSDFVLKIFCLSSFSAVSDTIDSSNTIVRAQNITHGVTKTITWDNSRAKYIVLSMGNTSDTALSESAVNTFKSSVNLVIEDLIGYDGLDKRISDLEANVEQLNTIGEDVETLETDVSELKDLSYENVTVPASIRKDRYWINDSQIWAGLSGRNFTLIEASEGDEFYIEGNGSESTYMYWLSDYVNPSDGDTPYIVEGTSKFWVSANGSKSFTAPAGTKYLYLLYIITAERSGIPAKLMVRRGGNAPKQESSELYYDGERVKVGNRLVATYLQALTDTQSGSTKDKVEGFAVINGYAAVTRLGGYISLYKLDGEKFYYLFCTTVRAFASNNAANWGVEKYEDSDVLPLLYVSYQGRKTAYVFRVQINGTCTLVQTITISNLPSVYCGEWAIDKERGKLIFYTTSIDNPASGDTATEHKAKHRVIVWPMPALRDGNEEVISNLVLNYNEAEEAYVMEDQPNNNTGYDDTVGYVDSEGYYTWVYQGIAAKNGKLIIPCGGWSQKRRRMLRVWDMDERRQINCIDLTHTIYDKHPLWEVEDCDVVDGSVYMFFRGLGSPKENTFANVYKLEFD